MGYIDFYKRVKSLVKIKKTTIESIVGEAGLSLASYNAYRRNENLPRADEAQIIAQALGTTVEYLVTGKNPELSKASEAIDQIQAVIDKYKNLKSEDKKTAH